MKIAVMIRAMDQDDGIGYGIERLVEKMLELDQENDYVLLYRTRKRFGRFSVYPNVKEVLLRAPLKILWDQVAVPFQAWREKADVIWNPKFSVPLVSPCPVAMGLQEPAWWVWPEHYEWWDVRYMRLMLPLYLKKAARVFPVSQFVLDENRRHVGLPIERATVTHYAAHEHIRVVEDQDVLDSARNKYDLPERFILGVTRVLHTGHDNPTWFPGKNVETTVRAFGLIRDNVPHRLVIAGEGVRDYLLTIGFSEADLRDIRFLGFVPHAEIGLLYNLADVFVLPSLYEGCPFPVIEALTCGCPIVASHLQVCRELTAGSALIADPEDPPDFAEKIVRVVTDETLAKTMREKSLERATWFSWDRTASRTLEGLTEAASR